MQNWLVDSDGSPSNLIQGTQRNVRRSLWSDTLYFIFVLVTKIREMTRPTLIILSNDVGTNLDFSDAVVCDSMHACSHLCAGMASRLCARLEGERHTDQPRSQPEHCGRRQRHCTYRRPAGNGCDVWSAVVQGLCLLSPQMSLLIVL